MADVFISYKAERRAAARHLSSVLEAHGFSVWYDYGLIPGEDFEPRLMAELGAAKVVVVLWCARSVASDWVCKEARFARAHAKFLPARIEAASLPQEFAGADTVDLAHWDGAPRSHVLDRLIDAVGRRVGRAPAPDFSALRALDEAWRTYGAPSLAQFALRDAPAPMRETSPAAPPTPAPGLAAAAPAPRPSARAETWEQTHIFQAVPGEVQTLAWSPDGARIAAEGTDSSLVTVWDARAGRAVTAYAGPSDDARPGCLAFSSDGAVIAAGYGPNACAFDAATGAEQRVFKAHGAHLCALAYLGAGALATANLQNQIRIWNPDTGDIVAELDGASWGRIDALRAFPDANGEGLEAVYDTLALRRWTPAAPGSLTQWQAAPTPEEREWPAAPGRLLRAADHNTRLDLVGADGRVRESWSTDRFKLATLRASPDRFLMIVDGAKLQLCSTEDGRDLARLAADGAWVRAAEFSPDGDSIATGDSGGAVRVWRRRA